ncbi:MAG: FHA domain-containing protein [Gammaproteobacteria bacterium]|nr:FHA domain-containing protein [Gammaproteobacteria bacterium]
MRKEEQKFSKLRDILDEDPTDEVPILELGNHVPPETSEPQDLADTGRHAILEPAPAPAPPATASGSDTESALLADSNRALLRLESEIADLQGKWAGVHHEITGRDNEIDRLRAELGGRADAIEALEAEVRSVTAVLRGLETTRDGLQEELRARESEHKRQQAEIAARDEKFEAMREDINALRAELAASQQEVAQLEQSAQERDGETAGKLNEIADLELQVAEQRLRIQDLEIYLDGSNSQRQVLTDKLSRKAEELSALERVDSTWEKNSLRQENEISRLEQTVARLERRCETLRRSATANDSDRLTLAEELEGARDRIADLERQRLEVGEKLAAAEEELERRGEEMAALQDKSVQMEESNAELLAAEAKLDLLNETLAARDEQLGDADDATELVQQERDELATELSEREIQVSSLTEELERARRRTDELKMTLADQAVRIEMLEQEIASRDQSLGALRGNMDRLTALESSLQALDIRMQTPAVVGDEDAHGDVTRLMIAVGDARAVKYPLFKADMIIGRAPDSDIQIRHKYISRHHAKLTNDNGNTFIEDLGSTNGVRVNTTPIQKRHLLHNGDLVDIGQKQFQFIDLMAPHIGQGNA